MSPESLLSRKAHTLGQDPAFPGSWSFLRVTRGAEHADAIFPRGTLVFPGKCRRGESIAMVASSSSFGLALVHGPELKGN